MSGGESLVINLAQESFIAQILPVPPLLSSSQLGWQGIILRHYRLPPHELPKYYPQQHVLLLHHGEYPLELDGRLRYENISGDQITVVPANISHEAKWKTAIEFTVLILERSAIARIAHESIDPDRVELLPHFTHPDPLISQIGLALKTEVETDGLDSSLYAESMATALSAHLLRHYSTRGHLLRDFEGLPRYKLRQATEYINEYLTENITLPELADAVGMSPILFG